MKQTGERDQGGRGRIASRRATQSTDIGISRNQPARWQKLAAVPEDEFEATVARPEKPSTTGIIAAPSRIRQRQRRISQRRKTSSMTTLSGCGERYWISSAMGY
jgi:hypothetical protein